VRTVPLVTPDAVGVADIVRRYESPKLRQEGSGERMIATEALRLGDEAEHPFGIAARE
jgi:hypothetical protein